MVFASCDKTDNNGYQGTNYIELSSAVASMYDTEDSKIDVTVSLTTSLAENLQLFLTVDGEEVVLENADVTIKAGEKEAGFTIKSAGTLFVESKEFKVSLDTEKTVLPEKVQWKGDYTFTVKSSSVAELTDAQKAIVETYKEATGVDLAKYLGIVNATVVFEECDINSYEYLDPVTFTTASIITLSDKSTAEQPVLKMTANPMGIEEKIYERFRMVTVESGFWTGENAGPDYAVLMNGINWNKDTKETFSMTLDGIKPTADKTVDFVAAKYSPYMDDEAEIVPFEYSFSAYEREKLATLEIMEGSDATANPEMHLNISPITEDYYESEGEGLWTAPEAVISDTELKFTFCFDIATASDYIKIVTTYTPNK